MFPPSPNEKKADGSIFARICYFLIGLVIGILPALRVSYYWNSPAAAGLVVLLFGFLGMLSGRKILEAFDV
jgi:VIT1/CCC1 family predicted Fe2+/Mn2+ transporter